LIAVAGSIAELRAELANINAQILAHRAGPAVRSRVLGAVAGTALGVFCAFSISVSSCEGREEVALARSPSGRVDAFVMEKDGGGTPSFDDDVYLAQAKEPWKERIRVASVYGAGTPCSRGVRLRWASVDTLLVEYLDACSAIVVNEDAGVGGDTVHVVLRGGVGDPCRGGEDGAR
jgi:hypothetical protein